MCVVLLCSAATGRGAGAASDFQGPNAFAIILGAASALCAAQSDPLSQARSLIDQGKVAESESILRGYLGSNPNSADAHFLLGYALFREQKAKDSLAELLIAGKGIAEPAPAVSEDVAKAMTWPLRSKRKIPMAEASSRATGCAAIVISARLSMCPSTIIE